MYNFTTVGLGAYSISPSELSQRFTHVKDDGTLVPIVATVDAPATAKILKSVLPKDKDQPLWFPKAQAGQFIG